MRHAGVFDMNFNPRTKNARTYVTLGGLTLTSPASAHGDMLTFFGVSATLFVHIALLFYMLLSGRFLGARTKGLCFYGITVGMSWAWLLSEPAPGQNWIYGGLIGGPLLTVIALAYFNKVAPDERAL